LTVEEVCFMLAPPAPPAPVASSRPPSPLGPARGAAAGAGRAVSVRPKPRRGRAGAGLGGAGSTSCPGPRCARPRSAQGRGQGGREQGTGGAGGTGARGAGAASAGVEPRRFPRRQGRYAAAAPSLTFCQAGGAELTVLVLVHRHADGAFEVRLHLQERGVRGRRRQMADGASGSGAGRPRMERGPTSTPAAASGREAVWRRTCCMNRMTLSMAR
jgi:hypothetical protein